MALVRWNPTKELMDVERQFSKLFNSFNERFGLRSKDNEDDESYENAVWSPLTDITENADSYVLNADLPGLKKDDVKISYKNGQLSISGERKYEKEDKDTEYHRVERAFGKFYRSFTLPDSIKEDEINAEFKDGSLKVVIPKAEEAKPKEIEVKVN